MKIEEIKREKCVAEAEPIQSVMEEAAAILKYKGERRSARSRDVSSGLRDLLATLEIEPLNETDVVRYQAEMIAELMLTPEYQADRLRGSVDYRFFHYWENTDMERYTDPIPEFVLLKAIQIKKAEPSVKFYIQTLEGSPDPFLLAKLEDDHAFIEVWEEPRFEGRLR